MSRSLCVGCHATIQLIKSPNLYQKQSWKTAQINEKFFSKFVKGCVMGIRNVPQAFGGKLPMRRDLFKCVERAPFTMESSFVSKKPISKIYFPGEGSPLFPPPSKSS